MCRQHIAFLRIRIMPNSRSLACPRWVPWRDSQRLESVFDQWSVRGFRWFTRFIQYKLTSVSAALMGIIRFLLTVRTVAVAAARYIGLRNMSDRKSLLLIWRFLEFALFFAQVRFCLLWPCARDSCACAISFRIEAGRESSIGIWACQSPFGERAPRIVEVEGALNRLSKSKSQLNLS